MSTIKRPLLKQFPGQCREQDAYVYIDSDGTVTPEYSSEIGDAIPMPVFNGLHLMLGIDNHLTQFEIDKLLNKIKPLAVKLMTNVDFSYKIGDGSDWTRYYTGAGGRLRDQIEQICTDTRTDEYDDE